MAEEPSKKDLTSLVELSALEMAKNPLPPEGDASLSVPPPPNLTEADFGSLEQAIELPSPSQISTEPPPPLEMPAEEAAPEAPALEHEIAVNERENPVFEDYAETPIDPARPAVHAPPAAATHTKGLGEAPSQKQDFTQIKAFAEKITIGQPQIEAAPAFSLMAHNDSGKFDAKTIKAIEDILGNEDYGLRIEDVRIQLEAGKLLVPQISEFAAISLAQKLRDVVDTIDVDLAAEIFKSSVIETNAPNESVFVDIERYDTHREEVHDISAEPADERDVFSSNLGEIVDYQVTRVLSVVTASSIVNAEIAENPTSPDFEAAIEKLTQELVHRAFKLGAHGVLGINFSLRSIEAYKDAAGKVRRAYRLIGSGTAVRARRKK